VRPWRRSIRQSLIGQSWRETSRLAVIMAVALAGLCVLVYAALADALRPTRAIRAGLERLAAGDLSARLPPFDSCRAFGGWQCVQPPGRQPRDDACGTQSIDAAADRGPGRGTAASRARAA